MGWRWILEWGVAGMPIYRTGVLRLREAAGRNWTRGFVSLTLILGALLLAGVTGTGFYLRHQSSQIADLTAEVALGKVFNARAVTAMNEANQYIEQLRASNEACVGQRTAAENKAEEAASAIAEARKASYRERAARATEIANESHNTPDVVDVFVSPRVTELLIEAAASANHEGSDSN